jgi:nucleoside-diphosphate-sugar epimerase
MNVVVPANVARTFTDSRIVAFSTGCVYPLVAAGMPGCTEEDPPAPVGEYANSCLGRERVFEYYSRENNTPVLLFRLNYAIDMKYGVLADVAMRVLCGKPVDLSVGRANVIWQGDANNRALLCLEQATSPATPLNITGPETLSIRDLATEFGRLLGRSVTFTGTGGGRAYLNDASRSISLFGPPRIPAAVLVRWTAEWLGRGGVTLGKPTHFTVTDGQFLDEPSTGANS